MTQESGASVQAYSTRSLHDRKFDVKFISRATSIWENGCNVFMKERTNRETSSSSLKKHADPSNLGGSLLEGNKDHLLSQARFELMKQEHQVGCFNNGIRELQQQTCAQRMGSQDAQHRYVESRREQVLLQEDFF